MYCKLAPPLNMNCPSASDRLRYYGLAFRVFSHPSIESQVVPTGNGSAATGCDNMRDTTEATGTHGWLRVVARAAQVRLTLPHTTGLRLTLLVQSSPSGPTLRCPPRPRSRRRQAAARVDVRRPAAGAHSILFARFSCVLAERVCNQNTAELGAQKCMFLKHSA